MVFKDMNYKSSTKDFHTIYARLRELFGKEFDEKELRYIAAFSGLLGRIAYADLEISEEEVAKIRKLLKKTTTLDVSHIDAIVNIVTSEIKNLAGLENHIYTKEIREIANDKQKEELMLSLFIVASADATINPEENEELRVISQGLGYTQQDFIEIRSLFKKYLSVFK